MNKTVGSKKKFVQVKKRVGNKKKNLKVKKNESKKKVFGSKKKCCGGEKTVRSKKNEEKVVEVKFIVGRSNYLIAENMTSQSHRIVAVYKEILS